MLISNLFYHERYNMTKKQEKVILLAEPYAVPLVARLDGNFLEMEKDWELMSELDKDELIQKKIVREL